MLFAATMLLWGGAEAAIGRLLRASATGGGQDRDARSFWLLWGVIGASCFAAGFLGGLGIAPMPTGVSAAGLPIVWAGLALRWTAILTLRRYFTVDVAIRADHKVVDHGVYAFVRHPSYTGALLSFFGLGLWFGTWPALLITTIPVTWAFLRRIAIEEAALTEALGDAYRAYAARTKRLVPGVY